MIWHELYRTVANTPYNIIYRVNTRHAIKIYTLRE